MYRSIEDLYDIIAPLGSGSYGQVLKAQNRMTGQIVAIKKIKSIQHDEGIPRQAIREIYTLQNLKEESENILSLHSVITTHPKRNVYLICDYFEFDLHSLLSSKTAKPLTVAQVKCYMIQLMNALKTVHSHGIIHRDLKPANILISSDNILKLGDFGLARKVDNRPLTNRVMTQNYRPPELALGATCYGPEVDIWSLGCTFYEMMTGRSLFYCDSDADQIGFIFKLFGVPSEKEWPEWRSLPNAELFGFAKPSKSNIDEFLQNNIPEQFKDSISLLKEMLTLNPSHRIKIDQALNDSYFYSPTNEYSPFNLEKIDFKESHSQSEFENKFFKKMKTKNIDYHHLYQELRPPTIAPPPVFAD